ncbi:MAG: helix-turn-helix domain-containing protein [Bacteroidales bacterium]
MTQEYEELNAARIAARYVNSTQRHVFLTGKAGTGKTTFLKQIQQETHKTAIVAAPTGIAAINAGGVTLHSLFQLPLGIFLPSNRNLNAGELDTEIATPASIMKHLKLGKVKRRMLQEMELLIIDEVSMLRADMCDAIDTVLRVVRRKRNLPFGGVQLLLIGDMQQLPPVVRNREWGYLSPYYKSMYFFDARAFENNKPVYIELEKIYRQHDPEFIRLLNHLRDDSLTPEDIKLLNRHHRKDLSAEEKEGAVSLTTHNRQADELNMRKLKELPGKSKTFTADVEGDFPERNYPVEDKLELKTGAQIMFVKNDYSGNQRYFNGKIGKVAGIATDEIVVEFLDGSEPVILEPYKWENKRYKLNKKTNEIEEKSIGSFEQYPVKLAWAITVHKSQGLTFDKAIIDVSRAFAPGQAYVALSRLRSLDGLMLSRPMPEYSLKPDQALSEFARAKSDTSSLKERLRTEAFYYTRSYLFSAFDFDELIFQMRNHLKTYDKTENRSEKQKHKAWAEKLLPDLLNIQSTGKKFQKQIARLMKDDDSSSTEDLVYLNKRVGAACDYFEPVLKKIAGDIAEKRSELGGIKGAKQYRGELEDMEGWFMSKLRQLLKSTILMKSLIEDEEPDKAAMDAGKSKLYTEQQMKGRKTSKKEQKTKDGKKGKSPTVEVSLELYKAGKTAEQIADERGLAISTIEGHLSQCVSKGLIPAGDFVDQDCMDAVVKAYHDTGSTKLSDIRENLDEKYTYSQLRYALSGYFAQLKEE